MANVVINLSESVDAKWLDDKDIVHQAQFKEAKKWIDNGIEKVIVDKEPKEEKEHRHEAITILGTRGSGKTTFLLSLLKHYRANDRISVLDIIDPTLMEEKGHIFLNIVSIINDLVQKKLDKNDVNSDHRDTTTSEISRRVSWNNQLLELSHGLPSIDGVGGALTGVDWQDPEYIMERGIRAVSAARNLAQSFQDFVRTALKILDKDLFILAFDDIDIDFKKGWPVLETIRKYLLTSRVITLLSGDLRLYSLSIRKQYWSNFGKALLINEADVLKKLPYFNERITEMESQYMLKVIKPDRRIHLTTLYEKIMQAKLQGSANESRIEILVGYQNIEIEQYYNNILARFGIQNKYQAEAYCSFLLSLPLRTQVQFLSEFKLEKEDFSNVNVVDAFLSDLIEKNVNINLINSTPHLLNVEILKLLLRERSLNEIYQLQPVTTDMSLNSSLVSLSLISSLKIKDNPYLIFDYFIKIGYVRNLLSVLGYEDKDEGANSSLTPSVEGLCSHSGIYQNKVLRDIAGNMVSYLRGVLTNVNLWGGIIPLLGLGDPAKKRETIIGDRIDYVFKNRSRDERTLGFIPLSICAYTTKNRTLPCYSIYTLLATVGELIRKAEQNDLDRGLAELSEIRTYGVPEFRKRINERVDNAPFLTEDAESESFENGNLKVKINEWVGSYNKKKIIVSPHLLGKISTRFFYALNRIENIEETTSLGEMMHIRIVALMNAILIEDVRENIESVSGFNINNTNLRDDIFVQNLQTAQIHAEKLQFSQWMLSCPLLLLYLNLDHRLLNSLERFIEIDHVEFQYYINSTIYSALTEVSARANKRLRRDEASVSSNSFDNWIEILRERGIPYNWFETTTDRRRTRENNENIRRELLSVFGEDLNSGKIRAFRNYLRKTGKQW